MAEKNKAEEKPVEKKEVWQLGQAPSEYVPVIVKGDVVLTANEVMVKILNDLDVIKRQIGAKE
jgi:hypothetical protein